MLNQVVTVGRVDNIMGRRMEVILKNDVEECRVDVMLSEGLLDNMKDLVRMGDLIGVKGSLSTDGGTAPLHINCEKITVLTSNYTGKGGE